MKDFMKVRNIILSSLDCARLRDLLITARQFGAKPSTLLDTLEGELNRATILPPEQIPPYVVTMNTCVRLVDIDTGKSMTYTLVFQAKRTRARQIAILSDLGLVIGFPLAYG